MLVIFTLGTGVFLGLNAQEAQKLSFSLQHQLSLELLNIKVGTVSAKARLREAREGAHLSISSRNLESKTLAVFLVPAGTS